MEGKLLKQVYKKIILLITHRFPNIRPGEQGPIGDHFMPMFIVDNPFRRLLRSFKMFLTSKRKYRSNADQTEKLIDSLLFGNTNETDS